MFKWFWTTFSLGAPVDFLRWGLVDLKQGCFFMYISIFPPFWSFKNFTAWLNSLSTSTKCSAWIIFLLLPWKQFPYLAWNIKRPIRSINRTYTTTVRARALGFECSLFVIFKLPTRHFDFFKHLIGFKANFISLSLSNVIKHGAKLSFWNCQRILPSIGVRELFGRGGGGGKPFAQKKIASCPNV